MSAQRSAAVALAGAGVFVFSVQGAMLLPLAVEMRNGTVGLSDVIRQGLRVGGWALLILVGAGLDAFAIQIDASARSLSAQRQDGLSLGSASAPLELEVFEDFQCPYCIRFTATVEPVIVDEFVATGKVRLVFRNNPILGLESELAARATVCAAEQGHGWDFALALFSRLVLDAKR